MTAIKYLDKKSKQEFEVFAPGYMIYEQKTNTVRIPLLLKNRKFMNLSSF